MILFEMYYEVLFNNTSSIRQLRCLDSPAFVADKVSAIRLIKVWNEHGRVVYKLSKLKKINIDNATMVHRDGIVVYIDSDSSSDIIDILR